MIDIINSFFTWVGAILGMWLNTEIIDGFTYLHVFIFLGIVRVITRFIHMKVGMAGKNEKSE